MGWNDLLSSHRGCSNVPSAKGGNEGSTLALRVSDGSDRGCRDFAQSETVPRTKRAQGFFASGSLQLSDALDGGTTQSAAGGGLWPGGGNNQAGGGLWPGQPNAPAWPGKRFENLLVVSFTPFTVHMVEMTMKPPDLT